MDFGGVVLDQLGKGLEQVETKDGRCVNLLFVIPAYREEIEYKLKYGMDGLQDRFAQGDLPMVLDAARPNLCADFTEILDVRKIRLTRVPLACMMWYTGVLTPVYHFIFTHKQVVDVETVRGFLRRKNIVISAKRYGIDALGAMAQGLFCSLLIGTILNTLGTQFGIGFLTAQLITINGVGYTAGGLASFMSGPAMAVAIGYALQAPPLVLFSLVTVGYACNALGGAGGPLAVLFVAIIAAEVGKAVSKETRVDILVTPIITILAGLGASWIIAPPIGGAASAFGQLIMRTTELQPFFMGVLVSVLVGIALTLPISSAAICAALGPHWPGWGRSGGWLLRQYGGFCSAVLPGEPVGRPGKSGHRHLHAPDAQHRQKSQDLAPRHSHLRRHRPPGHLCVPAGNERGPHQLRHGHLRPVRPVRSLDGLGEPQ